MDCLISYDSVSKVVTEAATLLNTLQKIGDFVFPTEVMIEGIILVSPVGANAQVVAIIDNGQAIGTTTNFPVTNVVCVEQVDPAESTQLFFPFNHGMKMTNTEHLGIYSYSSAALVAFTTYVTVYTRPFVNV